MLRTRTSRVPEGVDTSTSSRTRLPIRAAPIGEHWADDTMLGVAVRLAADQVRLRRTIDLNSDHRPDHDAVRAGGRLDGDNRNLWIEVGVRSLAYPPFDRTRAAGRPSTDLPATLLAYLPTAIPPTRSLDARVIAQPRAEQ
jgi:hypothetical protein